jgi:type 1 glutamine amidotransferase
MFAYICRSLLLCSWFLLVTEVCGQSSPPAKIVLIAGKKSHGPEGKGIHDYPWSVKLLKVMLDNSNVRDKVAVEFHLDGWPADEKTLDDAATILVISDGRDGDKYEEAPHFSTAAKTAYIERQINRGCGFGTFHFSTFTPDEHAERILRWSGGYFDWEENGQKKWYSAITTKEAEVQLPTADHPTVRGVKPFQMKEEFYYNIRFKPDDKKLKHLLAVPDLAGRQPDGNVVAWGRERDDGSRGFGTTCGHFYDNWQNENFRKFLLNTLVLASSVLQSVNHLEHLL